MSILKCKMCGGNVMVTESKTVGVCESCGCAMTVPSIGDEQKANLFNRANHFRRQGEFDKALSAYEHIVAEDDTIAEAHWGIVLCRYGIEYVEDPDAHTLIPTCHRTSFDSILSDLDYQQALQYADPAAKEMYKAEAVQIDRLQKDVLAISKQEAPYDIFISYKETSDGGSRTKDSVLAQSLYDRLTKEGYRVFFSRISLEDKVGQQYEPYIFAALNSAKVMLVVGTDRDHFNAPWVRNEWSRYLAILKKQGGRLLIPCYRDMDAYDLPGELSVFQCQDMGKIGFEQDLLRGIKKLIHHDGIESEVNGSQAASISALLKRASLFLQDCDWKSATTYFDRVLDVDPENGEAYAGKLCATMQVPNIHILSEAYISTVKHCFNPGYEGVYPDSLAIYGDYSKAVMFASDPLKSGLEEQEYLIKSKMHDMQVSKLGIELTALKEDEASSVSAIQDLKTRIQTAVSSEKETEKEVEASEAKCHTWEVVHNVATAIPVVIAAIVIIAVLAEKSNHGAFITFIVKALGVGLYSGLGYVAVGIVDFIINRIRTSTECDARLEYARKKLTECSTTRSGLESQLQQEKTQLGRTQHTIAKKSTELSKL